MALLELSALLFLVAAGASVGVNSFGLPGEVPTLGWSLPDAIAGVGVLLGLLGVVVSFGFGKLVGTVFGLLVYLGVAGYYLQQREERAEELKERAGDDPESVRNEIDELLELLGETDEDIRDEASEALAAAAEAFPHRVIDGALDVFEETDDPDVGLDALDTIDDAVQSCPESELPAAIESLSRENVFVRSKLASALADVGSSDPERLEPAVGEVVDLLRDDDPSVQLFACRAIAHLAMASPETARRAIEPLGDLLDLDDTGETVEVSAEMREFGLEEYPEPINRTKYACRALAGIATVDPDRVARHDDRIVELLDDEAVRVEAVRALGELVDAAPAAVDAASDRLRGFLREESDPLLRIEAARTLARTGGSHRSAALDALRTLLDAEDCYPGGFEAMDEIEGPRVSPTDVFVGYMISGVTTRMAGEMMADRAEEDVELDEEAIEQLTDERFGEWIDSVVQIEAARTLVEVTDDPDDVDAVVEHLTSVLTERSVALADDRAAEALADVAESHPDAAGAAVLPLMDLADDEEETAAVRREACRALGHVGADRAEDTLAAVANDPDVAESVRNAASDALDRIRSSSRAPDRDAPGGRRPADSSDRSDDDPPAVR